jgi:hypothetical protein
MNMIMLSIVAVAVFAYYGGASCPKILKDNKQMLMGVVVGLLLGSFFGVRLEGITDPEEPAEPAETRFDDPLGPLRDFAAGVFR